MFDFEAVVWVFSVGIIAALLVRQIRFSLRLPPGPYRPVIRNLFLQLCVNPNKLLDYRRYGQVISFRFLNIVTVMLNTQEAMRSMLVENGDLTSHRYQTNYVHPKLDFHGGVISAEGPLWREHRSFILSTLRKFGLTRYEQPIQEELLKMVEVIKKRYAAPGVAFEPTELFSRVTSNVINKMVYGEACELDDEELGQLVNCTSDFLSDVKFNGSILLELLGRAAFYVPGDWLHANRQRRNLDKIVAFIDRRIEKHSCKLGQDEVDTDADCLLDVYLRESKRCAQVDEKSSFNQTQIRTALFDLLIAGMDTTATTLRWSVLLLTIFDDVQRRVQSEIDEQLEGRVPSLADRSRLVYTEAVLHEVERFATIVPLGLPHKASETFTFRGYLIPKNCIIFTNIYGCHHDSQCWPDPFNFNPSNFYDEPSKSLRNVELLVPFSVGRRSCLGETLARQELWLFFVGLMQALEFAPSPGDPLPNHTHSTLAFIRSPVRFRVSVKARR